MGRCGAIVGHRAPKQGMKNVATGGRAYAHRETPCDPSRSPWGLCSQRERDCPGTGHQPSHCLEADWGGQARSSPEFGAPQGSSCERHPSPRLWKYQVIHRVPKTNRVLRGLFLCTKKKKARRVRSSTDQIEIIFAIYDTGNPGPQ